MLLSNNTQHPFSIDLLTVFLVLWRLWATKPCSFVVVFPKFKPCHNTLYTLYLCILYHWRKTCAMAAKRGGWLKAIIFKLKGLCYHDKSRPVEEHRIWWTINPLHLLILFFTFFLFFFRERKKEKHLEEILYFHMLNLILADL